jgi:hypothetical protein
MDRDVSIRRTLEQLVHCCEEALSVVMNDNDLRCALDDLDQADKLALAVRPRIVEAIARRKKYDDERAEREKRARQQRAREFPCSLGDCVKEKGHGDPHAGTWDE